VNSCAMARDGDDNLSTYPAVSHPAVLHLYAEGSGGCSRAAALVGHAKPPHLGAAVCLQILAGARHLHLAQLILLPLHQSVHLRQTGGHDKDSSSPNKPAAPAVDHSQVLRAPARRPPQLSASNGIALQALHEVRLDVWSIHNLQAKICNL